MTSHKPPTRTDDPASDWQPTACILCECNCGIEVQLGGDDGRRLQRFRGDRRHPISRGYACEKPHRLDYYQNPPDRLRTPLRRRPDGGFDEIDWDTAIAEVAARLARVRDSHGGASIFYYGGGGQGNHLPGAYAVSTRHALGMRYRSNALAQEKTGEFWVSHRMMGTATRADFEHCEVALFLGKNPWMSHGIARARVTLKEIARDPARTLIVIDPRRTKTATLADIHLQVRPGTDAWLLAALLAVLLDEGLTDDAFLSTWTTGLDEVAHVLGAVDIAAYCAHAGVPEAQVREAARRIGQAHSVATFEDLGVQMNRHSTLVSYLHRLLWLLTGNFGKPGAHYVPTVLVDVADGRQKYHSPVTGARIIGGLVPCNVIADEILSDHPARFRAMLVEAANPAHSLADSPRMREALGSLDTLVVIDVALTETAQLADYVLPASTQYEKAEATFFNFEFPRNAFHLRPRLLSPPEGPLAEAEIHARLVEALGGFDDVPLAALRAAAEDGLSEYAALFAREVAFHPTRSGYAPAILYRTLGPALPEALAEGAVVFGLALRCAMTAPASVAAAGFDGPPPVAGVKLFERMLREPTGTVFAVDRWEDVAGRVRTPGGRIQLALDDLLAEAAALAPGPAPADPAFPLVLSAGERRRFTANTIMRDPDWRKQDAEGALRIHPDDAARLGLASGDAARVTTRRGAAVVRVEVDAGMHIGHVSLPNGTGLSTNVGLHGGVALNELTETAARDPFAGTPWHKFTPARVEAVD
ncbi:molybdopterin-dependent oxidoreductase [Haliangium ochraceum]|uniref:Molybdopterin dinucleotide-binding region n=1 Tax=Haliangium ochraceum (strain DSM 14365 / JCM 11303 / SMP-2) TaxID=502025 RepID=D0LQZ6_HALO1|nr:molybdopterin-dependent oxidoreductase [Haliangium ochraceum]ACY15504.1 molybdopterin dinucleotide-binding region [Haliangium ochraceum DSM 14365]